MPNKKTKKEHLKDLEEVDKLLDSKLTRKDAWKISEKVAERLWNNKEDEIWDNV